jgi:hypothetical protein
MQKERSDAKTDRTFKLYVLYVHFGSPKDWPLRIVASSNGHGESLLPSPRIGDQKSFYPRIEFDHVVNTNVHQTWNASGGRASLVFFALDGKVPKAFVNDMNPSDGGDVKMPEIEGLNLNLSVYGRMETEEGRPCWRNCGTSLFTFKEIFEAKRSATPVKTHLVYNTGGGVKKADTISGCIAVSAAEDSLVAMTKTIGSSQTSSSLTSTIGGLNSVRFREAQSALSSVEYLDRDWSRYAEGIDKKLYGGLIRNDHKLHSRIRCTWSFTDLNLVKKRLSGRSGPIYEPDGRMNVKAADKLFRNLISNAQKGEEAIYLTEFCKRNKEEIRHVVDSCKSACIDCETNSERLPLPFFALALQRKINVDPFYWKRVLEIVIDRNFSGHAKSFYATFKEWHDGKKAAWGLAVVCLYAQSLEYVTDYYYSGSAGSEGEKIEVEQFGVPGRLMCGDCEDTESFHLQMLEAFYECPNFAEIYGKDHESALVLTEMRTIMIREYVAFSCIEAVNLSKQTVTGNAGHSNHTARSFYERASKGSTLKEAKSLLKKRNYGRAAGASDAFVSDPELYAWSFSEADSAHACLKLIPKNYFRNCVSRYYDGKDPFSPNDRRNTSTNRFFAHKPSGVDMPCLEGEGTSLLFTCDEEAPPNAFRNRDDTQTFYISEIVFWSSEMNEIIKSPIYPDKGFSPFLKGPLWGCTNETWFKDTYTYAFCRKDEETGVFKKGVSHEQISYKSDSVYVIPYAEAANIPSDQPIRDPKTIRSEKSTANTFFGLTECSPTMTKVCLELLSNRQTPLDIISVPKDPFFVPRVPEFPYVHGKKSNLELPKNVPVLSTNIEDVVYQQRTLKGVSESHPYNMLKDDARLNQKIQGRLLESWLTYVNSHLDPRGAAKKEYFAEDTSIFDDEAWKTDYFCIDAAYFNPRTLTLLMVGIFKLIRRTGEAVTLANNWNHGSDYPARTPVTNRSGSSSSEFLDSMASMVGYKGDILLNVGSCFVFGKLDRLSEQLAVWRISIRLKTPHPVLNQ